LRSSVPQFRNLLGGQGLFPSESDTLLFGFLDPIHLPLSAYLRLELRNGAQHMKQQASGGIAGVNVLVKDLKIDLLALKFGGNLAEV